jgi:Cu-Zn family superoxide dismutase
MERSVMRRKTARLLGACVISLSLPLLGAGPAWAEQATAAIHLISAAGIGKAVGSITLSDSADGMKLAFNLRDLPPGDHGIHIHENASCAPAEKDGQMVAGLAAGGHFDPGHTGHHMGPNGSGHLGDLEVMSVDASGMDTEITTAKRLRVSDVRGHAIVIHAGGDNYSDTPPMGGGGARIACGIIK